MSLAYRAGDVVIVDREELRKFLDVLDSIRPGTRSEFYQRLSEKGVLQVMMHMQEAVKDRCTCCPEEGHGG